MLGKRRKLRPSPSNRSRRPWAGKHCLRLDELEIRTMMSATATLSGLLSIDMAWTMGPNGVVTNANPAIPRPYDPADLRGAYKVNRAFLPNGNPATGAGQTIAIIDWYNEPTAASDINTFSSTFGLPLMNQGNGGPTFMVLNQNGGTNLSAVPLSGHSGTSDTSVEISLDIDWAHAMAPSANIVLFAVNSNSFTDLDTAVTTAATKATYTQYGLPVAGVISNSYGAAESSLSHASSETGNDPVYTTSDNHATFIFSSGDNGKQNYPAESPNALAIGGTTIALGYGPFGPTVTSESAWKSGGGGVSGYEAEPSWQLGVQTSGHREDPDVAFDANPSTGVWVTDTWDYPNNAAVGSVGGTSLGSPSWAGILSLVNQARAVNGLGTLGNAQVAMYTDITDYYSGSNAAFTDITTGKNKVASTGPGWDGVTGFGSPLLPGLINQLDNVASPAALVGGGVNALGGAGGGNLIAGTDLSASTSLVGGISGPTSQAGTPVTMATPLDAAQGVLPSHQALQAARTGSTSANYLFPTATVVAAKMGDTQIDAAQSTTPVENATSGSSVSSNVALPASLNTSAVDAIFADTTPDHTGPIANVDSHAVTLIGEDGGTADLALAAGMAVALSGSWGNVEWEPRRNQVSGI